MSSQTTDKRQLTLQFLAEPTDVNFGGKVHGGVVMKWIDLAGYACAAGWSGRYCVTAYVGGIRFICPIHIGMLVEVQAKVIYTGQSSLHLAIDVYCRDPIEQERKKATHCIMIFVAIDRDGKPVKVPTWEPKTKKDVKLRDYALKLMSLRQEIDEEMKDYFNE
ncbi:MULTISPECIES: acyl-CoA thioesterase [unclassified Hahella]|uniref:acyl-CoA thioesterase n=1 Tax=unclassified Hahella TaxID=2624107 RepID=UPI000FDD478A|nr:MULTISPECIES: acyl-CoA thioesterase [unclassified Hahella]AZZ94069.1 acyl-CoA thioesterase [Hahella sp. KA22]MBU6952138.1 acyl-CoA thioesterase [Hahella sp. HN01]MDG9670139.1 acyl-CoA thioesterase [Hahella sp. CR1]QAY57443.1 acyl-CoA thioesterase [Hahella sp. KA22]